MKQGLLAVDIQNDYFPGGKMELVAMERAADNAERIMTLFRTAGLPIFHIRHIAIQAEASFFLPQTFGAEINERVLPQAEDIVVTKHFPNSFRETDLLKNLREAEVDSVVICGAMSHMCIDATTRTAFDLGFPCTVLEDACATRDLSFNGRTIEADKVHGAFMAALSAVYAKVMTVGEYTRTI